MASITNYYTNDLHVVQNMISDLSPLMEDKNISMVGGDVVSGRKPIMGLEEGQPYLVIGIKNEDETVVKTYLKAKSLLTKENANYCDVEIDGKICPLVIVKKCAFKRL